MSLIPEELRYTKEHEWLVATEIPTIVRVGITDFAQSALGDIVYIQYGTEHGVESLTPRAGIVFSGGEYHPNKD